MSEYTPGPWSKVIAKGFDFSGFADPLIITVDHGDDSVTPICILSPNEFTGAREANAHLIAAAPDMYEALKKVALAQRRDHFYDLAEIDRIIARAEGK